MDSQGKGRSRLIGIKLSGRRVKSRGRIQGDGGIFAGRIDFLGVGNVGNRFH